VEKHGTKDWSLISREIPLHMHSISQCLRRWEAKFKPPIVKGPWTAEEDQTISELVKTHGAKKWSFIASNLPGRMAKQCRERYHNHLRSDISKAAWTEEEDRIILEYHQNEGNKWSSMTKRLPGRYVFVMYEDLY